MDVRSWYNEADIKIRNGDLSGATALIQAQALENNGFSREDRIYAAEIYRRVGLPQRALKILFSLVRSQGRFRAQRLRTQSGATDAEKAEYAGNLIRIGATEEAKRLLAEVDEGSVPMQMIFRGLAFIHEWNFRQAIAPLEKAIVEKNLPDYQRTIAAVNLGQSYFYSDRHEEARELLRKVIQHTERKKYQFLHFNALSLAALNEVFSKNWSQVSRSLGPAIHLSRKISTEGSYDALVLEKAVGLEALFRNGDPEPIVKTRARALEFHQPEIARDCDLQLALFRKDLNGLSEVYFFTPFSEYRRRIEDLATREGLSVPELWIENEKSGAKPLDLFQIPELKVGQGLFRLLELLLSERYRSFTLTDLATEVFPDTHFNFASSPNQLHQILKRARRFITDKGLPLEIEVRSGGYKVEVNHSAPVLHRKKRHGESAFSQRLRHSFGIREFRACEVAELCGVTQQNVSHLLRREIEVAAVERFGNGKATRYRMR